MARNISLFLENRKHRSHMRKLLVGKLTCAHFRLAAPAVLWIQTSDVLAGIADYIKIEIMCTFMFCRVHVRVRVRI